MLAEPGGDLDATLDPAARPPRPPQLGARIMASAEKVRDGDIDGALQMFFDGIDGDGAWARLAAASKQQLRDNVFTLIGQIHENRRPFTKADAQSIKTPTLFIGGAETRGTVAHDHSRALPADPRRAHRDDPGRRPLDVRAGAAGILQRSCWSFWPAREPPTSSLV